MQPGALDNNRLIVFLKSTMPHRLIVFSVFSQESSRVMVMMPVSKCSQVCAFDDDAGAPESTAPHRLIVFSVFSRVDHASQVDCFFKKLCSQWW